MHRGDTCYVLGVAISQDIIIILSILTCIVMFPDESGTLLLKVLSFDTFTEINKTFSTHANHFTAFIMNV